jgi:hypothetical protein
MRVRWWIISNEIIYYDNINWTLEFNKN